MKCIFIIYLLFNSWTSAEYAPIHGHFEKRGITKRGIQRNNPKHSQNSLKTTHATITNVKNTFVKIDNNYIYEINEFHIPESYMVDCHQHDIKIVFSFKNDDKEETTFGYLNNYGYSGNYVMENKTATSDVCKMLRRYFLIFLF